MNVTRRWENKQKDQGMFSQELVVKCISKISRILDIAIH